MVINMKSETPLACNMDVFTPAQRELHIQTTRQLFQTVQNIQQAENGFEFTLPNGTDLIKIGEFILNERRCCPFLKFTLAIDSDPKPITLLLSGPQGTQEFLREEFSEAFA
jgi:hypothetical protein